LPLYVTYDMFVVCSGAGWFLEKIVIKSGSQSTAEVLVFRCRRL